MKWAVAIYTEYNGTNEIKLVEAFTDNEAIQMAVEGFVDTYDTTVEHLIGYYWDSRKITVSNPVQISP